MRSSAPGNGFPGPRSRTRCASWPWVCRAGLEFRTKGQLAIDVSADALTDGIRFDFFCGDEVYGSCTELRDFFEGRGQAYVLRVP